MIWRRIVELSRQQKERAAERAANKRNKSDKSE
jgi:hypothetical protein